MKDHFIPQKLNIARTEISKKHPLKSVSPEYREDHDFIALLKRWASMPESDIPQEASIVPPRRLRQLVEYVSVNTLNLPLKNLVSIIRLRATKDIFRRLFLLWQDAYKSPDYNKLLLGIVHDHRGFATEVFAGSQLLVPIFENWLQSKTVPLAVGKICIQYKQTAKTDSFEAAMLAYMVSPESALGKACVESFYTFCTREDYRLIRDRDLERILQRYSEIQIRQFLMNFLSVLEVTDFQHFYFCGKYLLGKYTGATESGRFKKFFAPFPPALVVKYHRWLDYVTIKESFHNKTNDVRLIFWSNFVPYCNGAHMEPFSRSLILEFEHYVVVEFTEETMGALYIYEKSDFKARIQPLARRRNNVDFRSYLYNSPSVERIIHNGNWQRRTERYLKRNRITT